MVFPQPCNLNCKMFTQNHFYRTADVTGVSCRTVDRVRRNWDVFVTKEYVDCGPYKSIGGFDQAAIRLT